MIDNDTALRDALIHVELRAVERARRLTGLIEQIKLADPELAEIETPALLVGCGVAALRDEETGEQELIQFKNLVTTVGDQYYARMGIVGVLPAGAAAPTAVTGMKLGTGSTAATKSGSASALGTYISGSNISFDSSFPAASAVAGTDTGWKATYQCTWAAGVATNSAIAEVVIVDDSGTDATSTSAHTYARSLLSPTANKGSGQQLIVVWNHIFLGS